MDTLLTPGTLLSTVRNYTFFIMSWGWNTIDSDAQGVFTELVERLGVQNVQFDELYAIDKESLLAAAPVYAVVFLFKYSKLDREYAAKKLPLDGEYDTEYADKGIFFANQTIQNACATQAVLNSLLNKLDDIDIGVELNNLRAFVAGFDPEMAGETLSNSETLRSVHNSFSAPKFIDSDQLPPPDLDDKDDGLFHFITYLNINNTVYELDGLKQYPIKHETLDAPDHFYDVLPRVLQRRIDKYLGEIRFSLMAITNNKLEQYKLLDDEFSVQQELRKRETWKQENVFRRHDFPKLTVALLKNILQGMSDDEWEELLELARKKSLARQSQRFYK
ncbi:hypothetical protein C7M61_002841 [Candidozyma pseudohaemuli]|uniref:Ubiquitin carboxyl-terminal hydrolase n=1 Tax=Candidozyma pseudohaemuli TaxID=418784 RepID=A0A2P7YQP5_9ASCO|nr:hypothetical protein C7M61_002841 [[Candida] pseudohaemulonii]PSK38282.1 hypothetical protein C7M61_002841 [[Candida] pseudohaemulonii]